MEIQKPLITVILPTYRRPALLRRALRSVLAQEFPRFQVRVYDNASGDGTRAAVEEFMEADPRVGYYCHPVNIGPQKNFAFGLKQVDTPFFSFLSDDDILLPDFFRTALEGFDRYPDAAFSAGASIVVDEARRRIIWNSLDGWKREGYYTPADFYHRLFDQITWTGILFRRDVLDSVGYLDPEVGMAMDMDFQIRIAARHPFVVSRAPCAVLTYHAASVSGHADVGYVWPGWSRIVDNVMADPRVAPELKSNFPRLFKERMAAELYGMALASVINRDYAGALEACEVLKKNFAPDVRYGLVHALARLCAKVGPLRYPLLLRRACGTFLLSARLGRLYEDCLAYLETV